MSKDDKRGAIIRLNNGKRLLSMGRSLGLVIPKDWITLYASTFDDSYWVKVTQQGRSLIIEPLDVAEIEKMLEVNRV